MSNMLVPFLHVLDGNGDPYPGAKLYTYEAGTTTPLATYSDRALTSANANPVVADADGRFGRIFFAEDDYKLVLYTDGDVLVWTCDNYRPGAETSSTLTIRIKQIAASPLDYPESGVDAIGDGVADESAQVQNAIDASTGTVDLLGKTFRCDSALSAKSGLILRNGILDFSNCGDANYIEASGVVGDSNALTANAARGARVIAVTDGSAFSAGGWLLVTSTGSWTGSATRAEICRVVSVASDNVTVAAPLEWTYNTTDSATTYPLTMLEGFRLENVEMIMSPTSSGDGVGVQLYACDNPQVTGCLFNGMKKTGISVDLSNSARIERNTFSNTGVGGDAGCIRVENAARDTMVCHNHANRVEAFLHAGSSVNTRPVLGLAISWNQIDGCSEPIELKYCQTVVVDNNRIVAGWSANDHGIGVFIDDCGDVTISGNKIRESSGVSIVCYGDSSITHDGAPFSTSFVENICDNEIELDTGHSIEVRGNHCTAISITDCYTGFVSCNRLFNASGISINADALSIDGMSVDGNHVIDPSGTGISIESDAENILKMSVCGNIVHGVSGSANYCIYFEHTNGGATAIREFTVSNNILERDDDLQDTIHLYAQGAGEVTYGLVSNNVLKNGAYGLGSTNTTYVFASANVFESVTGEYETDPWSFAGVTYTITNANTDRTYNADSTTVEELADILATLIGDLTSLGLINS